MMATFTRSAGSGDAVVQERWQIRAIAIATAVFTNVFILIAGRIVNGEFPVADDQSIEFPQVIFVTILVGLVAWGLLALLERTTTRAASIWLAVATLIFLISLIGPLVQGENASSKVVLALMHLGAFMTIAPLLWRSALLPRT